MGGVMGAVMGGVGEQGEGGMADGGGAGGSMEEREQERKRVILETWGEIRDGVVVGGAVGMVGMVGMVGIVGEVVAGKGAQFNAIDGRGGGSVGRGGRRDWVGTVHHGIGRGGGRIWRLWRCTLDSYVEAGQREGHRG